MGHQVAVSYNPSTREAEAGGSGVWSKSRLQSKTRFQQNNNPQLGMAVHTYNPSTWKMEAGKLGVQGQPQLHIASSKLAQIPRGAGSKQSTRKRNHHVGVSAVRELGCLRVYVQYLHLCVHVHVCECECMCRSQRSSRGVNPPLPSHLRQNLLSTTPHTRLANPWVS